MLIFQNLMTTWLLVMKMKDFKNYHKINTSAKIERDALLLLQKSLDGYAGYEVLINDKKTTKVLMSQRYDSDGESMKVIGHIQDIERGDLIKYNGVYWLVTTMPEDNRIYRKAIVQLCSSYFPIKTEDKKVIVGFDKLNRPIYETVPGEVIHIPCVVDMTNASVAIADVNESINMLDNKIFITIPFNEHPQIRHDAEFLMYDITYRIIRIDNTKSIDGVGLTRITGELKGLEVD
ncbi:hypothetical protein ACFVRU_47745 [Streptomyces sp. NPDC057927]